MYLNTFKGLNELVLSHPTTEKIARQDFKERRIDKVNIVVHNMLMFNKHEWIKENKTHSVKLHTDILREQLGGGYSVFMNMLMELNIIKKTKNYVKGSHSNHYAFTDYALNNFEIIKAGVFCKKTEEKLRNYKNKFLQSIVKDPVHRKILYSLTDIYFIDKEIDFSDKTESEKKYHIDSRAELLKSNKFTKLQDYIDSSFYYITDKKGGRVYNTFTTTPKEYRRNLRSKDNKQLVELDMISCQPNILASMYINAVKFKRNNLSMQHKDKYVNEILDNNRNIINNIIYNNNIVLCCTNKMQLEELNVLVHNLTNDKFYKELTPIIEKRGIKDNVKKFVYKVFYGVYTDKLSKEEEVFNEVYPCFLIYIRDVKKQLSKLSKINKWGYSGNKLFSWIVQNKESNIFIRNFFSKIKEGTFAFPVHDAIVCKVEDAEKLKEQLVISMFEELKIFSIETIEQLIKQKKYV